MSSLAQAKAAKASVRRARYAHKRDGTQATRQALEAARAELRAVYATLTVDDRRNFNGHPEPSRKPPTFH